MSDVRLPPYLQRQIREVESVETRLCDCVTVREGPDGAYYVPDPKCDECAGVGSITVPDPEPLPDWAEPLPPDHPANFEESYTVGLGGSGPRR
jgi:hypothetical protein